MPTPNQLPRALVLAALATTIAVLAPNVAEARAPEKLVADLQLTSHTPGTPTGVTLHLVWPSNGPDGKPKAEVKGVFNLPDGTQIDESAVPTCTAGDQQLEVEGDAACPPGSHVGPGQVSLLTGVGAPVDPLVLDNQWYHGPSQIFALFTPHGLPRPIVTVNRVEIVGSSFVAQPALPPGYPPGSKTVPKQSDQEVHEIVNNGHSFVTTPPTCPASGKWVSHSEVTYDDGSVDTATSETPCT
jgi:hypothetical protein